VAEHTLGAYEAAIDSGADALECDVRLTRDGHLVCVHDRTVNRTSDGSGVVSELDITTLEAMDFSSWYAEVSGPAEPPENGAAESPYTAGVVPDRVERGGGVLRLSMLLELVADAEREVKVLIETKHPTRYAGLVEKTLVEELKRFGWAGRLGPSESLRRAPEMDNRVVVMSFAPTAVRRVRLLAPDIPTVLLLERFLPQRRAGTLPTGVSIAGPGLHLLKEDPDFVDRAHARGNLVYVWTVDDPRDVEFVLGLGVDTIITDHPAEVRQLLDRR